MDQDLKKKEDQELREYMKRYMVRNVAAAAASLIVTALLGYYGKKAELKK